MAPVPFSTENVLRGVRNEVFSRGFSLDPLCVGLIVDTKAVYMGVDVDALPYNRFSHSSSC